MRSTAELRELAWKRLWADHWFGRLFGGGLLLGLCGYAVQIVLSGILGRLHVQSWQDYYLAVIQNRHNLTTPIPNLTANYVSQASSSTVLTFFFSFLMAVIVSYGCAVILKKCLANDERGWLGEAFGGFKYPFGMLWLWIRLWLIWIGWSLVAFGVPGFLCGAGYPLVKNLPSLHLALVAGICVIALFCWVVWIYCIPFYRYRFLWLVKAEHPDWSAGECICACRKLMRGNMLKSFRLDCSYWRPLLLLFSLILGIWVTALLGYMLGSKALMVLGVLACSVTAFPLGWFVAFYVRVGQGFLYEELKGCGSPAAVV